MLKKTGSFIHKILLILAGFALIALITAVVFPNFWKKVAYSTKDNVLVLEKSRIEEVIEEENIKKQVKREKLEEYAEKVKDAIISGNSDIVEKLNEISTAAGSPVLIQNKEDRRLVELMVNQMLKDKIREQKEHIKQVKKDIKAKDLDALGVIDLDIVKSMNKRYDWVKKTNTDIIDKAYNTVNDTCDEFKIINHPLILSDNNSYNLKPCTKINGNLHIKNVKKPYLVPPKIVVDGNIYIDNASIVRISKSVTVSGKIVIENASLDLAIN